MRLGGKPWQSFDLWIPPCLSLQEFLLRKLPVYPVYLEIVLPLEMLANFAFLGVSDICCTLLPLLAKMHRHRASWVQQVSKKPPLLASYLLPPLKFFTAPCSITCETGGAIHWHQLRISVACIGDKNQEGEFCFQRIQTLRQATIINRMRRIVRQRNYFHLHGPVCKKIAREIQKQDLVSFGNSVQRFTSPVANLWSKICVCKCCRWPLLKFRVGAMLRKHAVVPSLWKSVIISGSHASDCSLYSSATLRARLTNYCKE